LGLVSIEVSKVASANALHDVLVTFASLVAREVVRELRSGPSDLIPQATSPLGKRRHCAAVRARVQRGDSGGCIVGRVYYLTPAALQEELAKGKVPKRRATATATAPRDELAELRAELGIVLPTKHRAA
jgi:hypothetical protein